MNIIVTLTTPMLGTVAKDKKLYATYIESKKPDTILEDETETVPENESAEIKGWTGFHSDDTGLFVYDYLFKGFIKNSGNVQKDILKVKGLRSKLNNFLFVSPRRLYLKNPDGSIITEPHDVNERPLLAQTPKGPRVTLVRSDQVNEGTTIDVNLMLLAHPEINDKKLLILLDYGTLMGLGQFRNGGFGRFTYEVVK